MVFLGCLRWSSPVLLDERVWKIYCEFRAGTKLQVTKLTVLVAAGKQGGRTFKSGTCTFLSWKAYHGVNRSFSILSFNSLNSATLTQIEAELFSSRNFSEHLLDTKCLGPFIMSTIYQMKLSQLKYSFQANRHRGALCSEDANVFHVCMLTTRMSEDTCRSRFIKYTLDVLSQNKSHKKNWLWAFSTSVPSRSREDPFQISTSIYFISQLWMRIQTPSTDFPWKQNPKIQHHGFSLSCSCSMDSLGGKYSWNVLNYAAMLWKNNSLFYEQESFCGEHQNIPFNAPGRIFVERILVNQDIKVLPFYRSVKFLSLCQTWLCHTLSFRHWQKLNLQKKKKQKKCLSLICYQRML